MFERYTEKARRVIFQARYEASQFGSPAIETEHLLLGLMREDKSLTNRFLRSHSSIENIRKEIEGRTIIRDKVSTSIDLPLSAECKRILAFAADEAERLRHRHIAAEHLLLGILREDHCLAAEILERYGLRLTSLRTELKDSGENREEDSHFEEMTRQIIQSSLDEAGSSVSSRQDTQAVVKAIGITKTYPSISEPLEILRGINLTAYPGEIVAITGESGSGKSTLLHVLGALDRPTSGTVQFGDTDPFALTDQDLAKFRRHSVGFIFQFHNLLPEFSALENVLMPRLISGDRTADSEGVQLLELVGLGKRLRHRPGELSGGEQQRVAIARALINKPTLVLADEPTGSLDHQTGEMVFSLFQKIQQEKNLTSILATHNAKIASSCNRLLRLENGILQEISKNYV